MASTRVESIRTLVLLMRNPRYSTSGLKNSYFFGLVYNLTLWRRSITNSRCFIYSFLSVEKDKDVVKVNYIEYVNVALERTVDIGLKRGRGIS